MTDGRITLKSDKRARLSAAGKRRAARRRRPRVKEQCLPSPSATLTMQDALANSNASTNLKLIFHHRLRPVAKVKPRPFHLYFGSFQRDDLRHRFRDNEMIYRPVGFADEACETGWQCSERAFELLIPCLERDRHLFLWHSSSSISKCYV